MVKVEPGQTIFAIAPSSECGEKNWREKPWMVRKCTVLAVSLDNSVIASDDACGSEEEPWSFPPCESNTHMFGDEKSANAVCARYCARDALAYAREDCAIERATCEALSTDGQRAAQGVECLEGAHLQRVFECVLGPAAKPLRGGRQATRKAVVDGRQAAILSTDGSARMGVLYDGCLKVAQELASKWGEKLGLPEWSPPPRPSLVVAAKPAPRSVPMTDEEATVWGDSQGEPPKPVKKSEVKPVNGNGATNPLRSLLDQPKPEAKPAKKSAKASKPEPLFEGKK